MISFNVAEQVAIIYVIVIDHTLVLKESFDVGIVFEVSVNEPGHPFALCDKILY